MQCINDTDLLRSKIMQIKSALLNCYEDRFKFEAILAETLELDQQRILWLLVDRPADCAGDGEGSFDIVLNYHKKGLPFDLDILGAARIVNDREAIKNLSTYELNELEKGRLLLRVEIIDVDYWEQKEPVLKSIVQKIRYMISGHPDQDDKHQVYPDHQMSA